MFLQLATYERLIRHDDDQGLARRHITAPLSCSLLALLGSAYQLKVFDPLCALHADSVSKCHHRPSLFQPADKIIAGLEAAQNSKLTGPAVDFKLQIDAVKLKALGTALDVLVAAIKATPTPSQVSSQRPSDHRAKGLVLMCVPRLWRCCAHVLAAQLALVEALVDLPI